MSSAPLILYKSSVLWRGNKISCYFLTKHVLITTQRPHKDLKSCIKHVFPKQCYFKGLVHLNYINIFYHFYHSYCFWFCLPSFWNICLWDSCFQPNEVNDILFLVVCAFPETVSMLLITVFRGLSSSLIFWRNSPHENCWHCLYRDTVFGKSCCWKYNL